MLRKPTYSMMLKVLLGIMEQYSVVILSFLIYEGKDDYFTCFLGHELAHSINNHQFNENLLAGRIGKNLKEEKKNF